MSFRTIAFFYPTRKAKIGGAQKLLIRVVTYLAKIHIKVIVYDYEDGYCFNELSKLKINNVRLIPINNLMIGHELDDETVLVLFNDSYKKAIHYKCTGTKILFWDLRYSAMKDMMSTRWGSIPLISNFSRKLFFRSLAKNCAICTVEVEGKKYIKELTGYDAPQINIPIDLHSNSSGSFAEVQSKISYIGRSCTWKITPVVKLVEDLFDSGIEIENFMIFTDSANTFDQYMESFLSNAQYSFFKDIVEYKENLGMEEIVKNIKYCQLNFAMATAALDVASYKLPVISLDFSETKFPNDYKYRFLYDNFGNDNLAQDLNAHKDLCYKSIGNSLQDVLTKSLSDRDNIIDCNLNYVVANHSVDSVVEKLLLNCTKTSLTFRKYKSMMLKNPFGFLLVVKNKIFKKTIVNDKI